MQETDFLPRKEFAKRFGVHVRGKPYALRTIICWERQGLGPMPIRVGRDVLYSWGAAMKWLQGEVERAA
jgi:hypothetical protein